MNWINFYRSIPDRVRIGVGGLAAAVLFVAGPSLFSEWIRFWS